MKIAKWILAPVLMIGVQQASAAACAQALNASTNNPGKAVLANSFTKTITGSTASSAPQAPATKTATLKPATATN